MLFEHVSNINIYLPFSVSGVISFIAFLKPIFMTCNNKTVGTEAECICNFANIVDSDKLFKSICLNLNQFEN